MINLTAPQVATMTYVKQQTTIPVPTVYGYCKDEHNPIGCPFMIMEHVCALLDFSHFNH